MVDLQLRRIIVECFPNNSEIVLFMETLATRNFLEGARFLYVSSNLKTTFSITCIDRLSFHISMTDSDDFLSFSFGDDDFNMDLYYLEFIEDLKLLTLQDIMPFFESKVLFLREYSKKDLAKDHYTFIRNDEIIWSRSGAQRSPTYNSSLNNVKKLYKPWIG